MKKNRVDDELSFATNKKNTIKFKIVFIGDQNVGKSSIINRFIKNEFDTSHHPTVGIDFVSKSVVVSDKAVRLQLWDTAGQERFRSLIPGYLRDSNAVFLVYDVTNVESFNNVMGWVDYVKDNRGDDALIYIIGNKIDADEQRAIKSDEAKQKFSEVGAHLVEVSAKTGENLQKLFHQTCQELMNLPDLQTTIHQDTVKCLKNITGEVERPIIKTQKADTPKRNQTGGQIRGSKLVGKKAGKGTIVKQKNCC